jgi:hypothetical protein
MPAAETLVVPARVDAWYVIVVALALAGLATLVAPLLLDPDVAVGARLAVAAMGVAALALSLGTSVPVRYLLEPEGLTVRAGFLTLRLAYRDVVRATPVLSPLAGPSWSLVRVRVALAEGGWIEVAPRDRAALLAELAARAPHLQPHGRGLLDPARARRKAGR